ncbi:angiotensinogen [Scyliorhinus canicula]|uniref:angiotensinogen n=1 Tax=Scyliorhinus canicula TaxID=7830 RepID=UPI0018F2AFE0|nr:angiotensinogen [Scyliorhinus canicula]
MRWIFSLLWMGALLEWGTTNRPYIHPFKLLARNQTVFQEEMDQNNSFLPEQSPVNVSGEWWKVEEVCKSSRIKVFTLITLQKSLAKIWFATLGSVEGSGVTLLSPFQLYGSLAAISLGAGGTTAQSFRHHLGLVESEYIGDQHSWIMRWQSRLLHHEILARHEGSLSTGSWLIFRKGMQLPISFRWELWWFNPEVQLMAANINSSHSDEEAINSFIHNASAGRVSNLVTGLSPSTNLVLASYIHFKGKWKTRSQCPGSEFQDFFNDGKSKLQVSMTTWCGKLQYTIDPKYTLIQLPLNGTAYMMVVQPVQSDKLQEIESTLDVEGITLKTETVKLIMPRIKWDSTYDVKELYRRMRLPDMLGGHANFSRLSNVPELTPDQVKQRVIFEVGEDEEKLTPAGDVPFSNSTITTEIRIDKPFFFRVHERRSKQLLFLGRVEKLH